MNKIFDVVNVSSFFDEEYFTLIDKFKVAFSPKLFKNLTVTNFKYVLDEDSESVINELNVPIFKFPIRIEYQFPKESMFEKYLYMTGPAIEKYDLIVTIHYETYTKFLYARIKERPKRAAKGYSFVNFATRYEYFNYNCKTYNVSKVAYRQLYERNDKFKISPFVHKKKIFNKTILTICFDCETMIMNDRHQPYLLAAHLNNDIKTSANEMIDDSFLYELEDFNKLDNSRAGEKFVEWIYSLGFESSFAEYDIVVFGYNNDNFDNNFIIDAFRKIPNNELHYNARYGKITEFYVSTANKNTIRFKDIYRFIPDQSLKSACEYYGVADSKMEVDIVKYNNLCVQEKRVIVEMENEDQFKSCLKNPNDRKAYFLLKRKYFDNTKKTFKIYELIKEYCQVDVKVTMQLFDVIQQSYTDLIKDFEEKFQVQVDEKHIFDFISIPSMAYTFFTLIMSAREMKHLTVCDTLFGQFILNSYYGGRTCYSLLGKYNFVGKMGYVDVTSMYPLAMTALYPHVESYEDVKLGENVNVTSLQNTIDDLETRRKQIMLIEQNFENVEWLKCFDENPFIVLCDIFPPENLNETIACFPPIASRIYENNVDKPSLRYNNCIQKNKVLTSQHIKTLIFGGWHVKVCESEHNIYFMKTVNLFNDYMDFFGEMKKKAKDVGNKAAAKWAKGLMNYLYGKMCLNPISLNITQNGSCDLSGTYTYDSFKVKHELWNKSLHYLAAFITSYSNWMLFSTIYRLAKNNIVKNIPHSLRLDIIYCDTDSIVYDSALVDKIDFNMSEELGCYVNDKADFNITWKTKYSDAQWIIVFSKKCYVIGKNNEIIISKFKGLHKAQADLIDFKMLIKLLSDKTTFNFAGLAKQKQVGYNFSDKTSYFYDIINNIVEIELKKTLKLDEFDTSENITCLHSLILEKNEENFDKKTLFIEDNLEFKTKLNFLYR